MRIRYEVDAAHPLMRLVVVAGMVVAPGVKAAGALACAEAHLGSLHGDRGGAAELRLALAVAVGRVQILDAIVAALRRVEDAQAPRAVGPVEGGQGIG